MCQPHHRHRQLLFLCGQLCERLRWQQGGPLRKRRVVDRWQRLHRCVTAALPCCAAVHRKIAWASDPANASRVHSRLKRVPAHGSVPPDAWQVAQSAAGPLPAISTRHLSSACCAMLAKLAKCAATGTCYACCNAPTYEAMLAHRVQQLLCACNCVTQVQQHRGWHACDGVLTRVCTHKGLPCWCHSSLSRPRIGFGQPH